jgi:hypothetical protein
MAMAVVYTTVNGEFFYENRGGVETFYTSDPLGNLAYCTDVNGNTTYSATYAHYGEGASLLLFFNQVSA